MRSRMTMAFAAWLALGSMALAQQTTLAGKATDEAKAPFTNYAVQLRDIGTGQVASRAPLNDKGLFSFALQPTTSQFLVELTQDGKVLCTEGPFTVGKTDVNISCGKKAAGLWLLTAAAGTATAVSVATRSTSR